MKGIEETKIQFLPKNENIKTDFNNINEIIKPNKIEEQTDCSLQENDTKNYN